MDYLKQPILDTFSEIEVRINALLGKDKNGKQVHLSEFYQNDTVLTTVLISNLFERILPQYSGSVKATDCQQKDFDFVIRGKKVEMKMTAGKNLTSFTSASHQGKEGADNFMFIRYGLHPDRNIPQSLGMWVTPSLGKMPLSLQAMEASRIASRASGKSGFTSIRIASEEAGNIRCIFGDKKLNKVWTKQVMENVEY